MVFWGVNNQFSQKIKVVAIIMTKAKFSCELDCNSCFVDKGLQMLISLISMVLSESLVYTCDPQS